MQTKSNIMNRPAGSPALGALVLLSLAISWVASGAPTSAQGSGSPAQPPTGAGSAVASRPASRRDDPQIVRTRERYQSSAWAVGERRAGLDLSTVRIQNYTGGPVEVTAPNASVRRIQPLDQLPQYLIESWVFETCAGAHDKLAELLAFVTNPENMPAPASFGFEVGDAAYVGPSGAAPGRIAWIAFVRGNIAIRVVNLKTGDAHEVEPADVSRAIDRAILASPRLPDQAPLPKPAIESLQFEKPAATAGEIVRIQFKVPGATDKTQYQWTVGGPGQGYVERTEAGTFALYTTGAGKINLVLDVTNPMGVTTSATASIEVAAK